MLTIAFAGIAATLLGALVALWRRLRRTEDGRLAAERSAAETRSQNAELTTRVQSLTAEVERLAPWQTVADVAAQAMQIQADAESAAARIRAEATEIREAAVRSAAATVASADDRAAGIAAEARAVRALADSQAAAAVADARRQAEETASQARLLRLQAERDAAAIVAEGQRRAEEIAGDALAALEARRENERVARAIENVIEGYGDRYIIPTTGLLDDLAEGFGHTEAGQRMKEVRTRARSLSTMGQAAECDYVEQERKTTAIRFVTDAFNGKVDSILADVRTDNYGTLEQKIRDAFTLVNHNGAAFRRARIREDYLSLRLEELRWAVTLQELKQQEREEQRRIKEQLREEEKARREYERALREAARDEETLRKAMEKAQAQLARASEEQKAKYEAQLAELRGRLLEAEARGQRAMSMAQQTRRGHVYVISNVGSFGENVYKIGLTRRLEPLDRIRELGDSSVPFEFDVHALIWSDDAPALETRLHKHFVMQQINKVNHRKEFFRVGVADLRDEIEKLGLTAQWTMTAAAREYRETLAIEAAIEDNPAAREAWVRRQLLLEPSDDPFAGEEEAVSAPRVALSAGVGTPAVGLASQ